MSGSFTVDRSRDISALAAGEDRVIIALSGETGVLVTIDAAPDCELARWSARRSRRLKMRQLDWLDKFCKQASVPADSCESGRARFERRAQEGEFENVVDEGSASFHVV